MVGPLPRCLKGPQKGWSYGWSFWNISWEEYGLIGSIIGVSWGLLYPTQNSWDEKERFGLYTEHVITMWLPCDYPKIHPLDNHHCPCFLHEHREGIPHCPSSNFSDRPSYRYPRAFQDAGWKGQWQEGEMNQRPGIHGIFHQAVVLTSRFNQKFCLPVSFRVLRFYQQQKWFHRVRRSEAFSLPKPR